MKDKKCKRTNHTNQSETRERNFHKGDRGAAEKNKFKHVENVRWKGRWYVVSRDKTAFPVTITCHLELMTFKSVIIMDC